MIPPTEATFNTYISIATELEVPLSGSIGRAALIGQEVINPLRPNGSVRDVDVVNVGLHACNAEKLPEELEFDRIWFSRFLSDGCLIYPGKHPSKVNSPKVIVPVPELDEILSIGNKKTINGQSCLTLRPETQLAIDLMFGNVLPKNAKTVGELAAMVESIPRSQRLDPELLEPFATYAKAVKSLWRRRLYLGARATYHAVTPVRLKQNAHPFIKKLARGKIV